MGAGSLNGARGRRCETFVEGRAAGAAGEDEDAGRSHECTVLCAAVAANAVFRRAQSASAGRSQVSITRLMGVGSEKPSAWIVLAGVGVVALAGVTLRVKSSKSFSIQRQTQELRLKRERERAQEHERLRQAEADQESREAQAPPQPR